MDQTLSIKGLKSDSRPKKHILFLVSLIISEAQDPTWTLGHLWIKL